MVLSCFVRIANWTGLFFCLAIKKLKPNSIPLIQKNKPAENIAAAIAFAKAQNPTWTATDFTDVETLYQLSRLLIDLEKVFATTKTSSYDLSQLLTLKLK